MKKLIGVVLATILIFTFSACNQKDLSTKAPTEKSSVEKKKEEPKQKDINKGDLVKIDDYCEFTINDAKFGKRINPPKPGDFYTYYETKETGTTYLDTVINVKSLLTSGKSSDDFLVVKVFYDGKYEYNAFSVIEKNGGADFTYTNITQIEPLKNGVLHFLAEVPEEVEKDNKPLMIVITANKQEFKYKMR